MKIMTRMLGFLMVLTLCTGYASAEKYVSVVELKQQAETSQWGKADILIPSIAQVPVAMVQIDDQPIVCTVGSFDEAQSGKFISATRYGKTPPYTTLANGFTLEAAQSVLNEELSRLADKDINHYGLIWTEIAKWQNMESWLLCYGRKFFDLTCFSHSTALTMDIRTRTYHHLIIPHYEVKETPYHDVPLLAWPEIQRNVETYLSTRRNVEAETLELGYLMRETDEGYMLVPVWHLGLFIPNGFDEVYFSAQTGEKIEWNGKEHILSDVLDWSVIR